MKGETWMAMLQTMELRTSAKALLLLASAMRATGSRPRGRVTAAAASRLAAKEGRAAASPIPIPAHWLPIPVNTSHRPRFSELISTF